MVEEGGAAEKELGGKPPVGDIDEFFGIFDCFGNSPEVITAVDVPFDLVVLTDREVGVETVLVTYGRAFVIRLSLVFFVMTMVGVEQVA